MWIVTDCSRSGDFRSLTSHFRKRRSTAYSEPGASHHDPTVSAATEASNSTPSHDTANEVGGQRAINLKVELGRISTQVMDMVDRRIEGVEETMVTMNRAIRRLTRKVVSTVTCCHNCHLFFIYIDIFIYSYLGVIHNYHHFHKCTKLTLFLTPPESVRM